MKQKNVNVLLFVGVVAAILLLMVWLFLGTSLEEEVNPVATPNIEQNG